MNILKLMKALFTSTTHQSPTDCGERVRHGHSLLVDVREPGEWQQGVAEHATLLPLSDLTGDRVQWRRFLAAAGEREILLYCASGARSGMAARLLAQEGFRVSNTGGLTHWAAAAWPIVPPARS